MRVSRASLDALEFESLRRVVAEFAVTDLGVARLLSARTFDDIELLRSSLAATRELDRLLDGGPLVRGFEEELAPLAELILDERAELHGSSLLLAASVLKETQSAIERIRRDERKPAALLGLVSKTVDLAEIVGEIARRIDERGRVRDDASPKLKRLVDKGRRTRQGVYSRLGTFVSGHRESLAEETVSVHDGRLVLLLRSGAKGRVPGIVQGRSATGRSFYFEPLEFVEANNELQEGQREEEAERQRILADLVALLRAHSADIEAHWNLLGDLDARQALCHFRRRVDGHFIEPDPEADLELIEARHPLLVPELAPHRERALGQPGHTEAVVPLGLRMDKESKLLVVTGPNAGGKTVALKTVGLLALASHSGFPLPAALHSRIPFLSSLVAVVGDDQDLLAERSTFSGRLLRLAEVWSSASDESLLLVDELGSGTDPTEGAALGISLVESLAERASWTLITTHLSAIAATALELEGAGCAAMEFDASSGQPTYRLVPGAPGGSEALALARRLELPREWIARAEELLGPEERRLRRLLQEVEESKRALVGERAELEQMVEAAAKDRAEAATLLEKASREKAEIGKRLERELRDFRVGVKRELKAETDRMRKELRVGGGKRASVPEVVERLFEKAPQFSDEAEVKASLAIGDQVEHRALGWAGTLEGLRREKASVLVHGKKIRCDVSELRVVESAGKEPARTGHGIASAARVSTEAPAPELLLIGQRVEPALEELEKFLDRAILTESDTVRIVHGHGSGRLRRAVRDRLRQHPVIAEWRPGGDAEGGDGATVARFRD